MSNDEKKIQPIFQILHIKIAWFLLELAMALVTPIGMRFLQVWLSNLVIQGKTKNLTVLKYRMKLQIKDFIKNLISQCNVVECVPIVL